MEKIAIITDSAADLPIDLLKKYNINVLPFRVIYSNKEYEDGVTIHPEEVYSNLEKEIPTTSLPNIQKIEDTLCSLEENGYTHVIAIHISHALSGTANSVRLALENHPNLTSFLYDTKTLSIAQGIIVLNTAKLIEQGKSFEEIVNTLPMFRKNVNLYFTLNTLEYLKKGGRIGKVAGTVGELLNLKPIIIVDDTGVYQTYAKLRGRKQSINKLKSIAQEYLSTGRKYDIWVMDGYSKEEGDLLFDYLKTLPNINEIHRGIIGPSLGVHTGPGLVGFGINEVE